MLSVLKLLKKILISALLLAYIAVFITACTDKEVSHAQSKISGESVETTAADREISAEDYLKSKIVPEYRMLDSKISLESNADLKTKTVYFNCDKFKNILVGWIIADLNNDDVDDIFTVTVEKDYSDYENTKTYDTIKLHYASYIAGNGSFKKNSDISRKLFITYLRLPKHSEIEYHFAIVPDTNGKSIIIRSSEFKDDSEIYSTSNPPYYSVEDSLGNINVFFEIERYKENDYDSPFGIQFSCDHISAMPEAESINYFDISNGESLYFNGVTQVSIDSDSPQPRLYSEKKGKFSSEKDALNSINKNLDSYGLSRYNLKPFSWDSRESNLLIVNEDNNISCSFKIVGNSDSNSKNGLCYIEPNGSNK